MKDLHGKITCGSQAMDFMMMIKRLYFLICVFCSLIIVSYVISYLHSASPLEDLNASVHQDAPAASHDAPHLPPSIS